MRKIIILSTALLSLLLVASCTKYNLIDTGLPKGVHNTTMWEYFKTDSYNWDSVMIMIDHAHVRDIFDGTSQYGNDITFFGITNHSIRRYMLRNGFKSVKDIPSDECKKILFTNVLLGRYMLNDFIPGRPSDNPDNLIGQGGKEYTNLADEKLWIYTFRGVYGGVPEAGPLAIHLVSLNTGKRYRVASSNIQTTSGIVHSMEYQFTVKDF